MSEKDLDSTAGAQPKRRPRSATLLNMNWLRERLEKVEALKNRLATGSYKVDSSKIARAVLNEE